MYLPAVSFGYIYSKYTDLEVCFSGSLIPSLGLPQICFLAISILCVIAASILYGSRHKFRNIDSSDIDSGFYGFLAAIVIFLTAVSSFELGIRACNDDLALLLLLLLHISIPIVALTEKTTNNK